MRRGSFVTLAGMLLLWCGLVLSISNLAHTTVAQKHRGLHPPTAKSHDQHHSGTQPTTNVRNTKKKASSSSAVPRYEVRVRRLNTAPVLTDAFSAFDFNYNSAYLTLDGIHDCLAVRVQNVTDRDEYLNTKERIRKSREGGGKDDEPIATTPPMKTGFVGPSSIAIACADGIEYPFGPLRSDAVVLDPTQDPSQALGVEDPRIVQLRSENMLYMFYTAVNSIKVPTINPNGDVRAMLALATCNLTKSPDAKNWTLHGPLFPDIKWSKSGALLVRDQPPHYLFWGDLNVCVAHTTDFINYNNTGKCILEPRADSFDSELCESGPPPMKLTDGNYVFVYNSAKKYTDPTPHPFGLQYNTGYAILSGNDPTQVLQRSSAPIMSPDLNWEKCDTRSKIPGLTPNVVFTEGAKRLSPYRDEWILYYQGCDSRMGLALLTVTRRE